MCLIMREKKTPKVNMPTPRNYRLNRKTFAKEPKLAKLLRELKSTPVLNNKKSSLVYFACQ